MTEPALQLVTPDNVAGACALRVRPGQRRHVEPVAESLALAYTLPTIAWPRVVYAGSTLVAFVMAFHGVAWPGDPPGSTRSGLWRLNVGAEHQRQGYGSFAVRAVCADLRSRAGTTCFVTWAPGARGPGVFYRRLGFRPTGELSGDEVVARLDL